MAVGRPVLAGALVMACVVGASSAAASELVFRPVNPGFGGFPSNIDYLLGTANAQNQFRGGGGGGTAPVINFPDIDIDLGGDPTGEDTPGTGGTDTGGTDTGGTDGGTTGDTAGTQTTGAGGSGGSLRTATGARGDLTFSVGNN
ncbi:MAG: curli assembly protein CsgF [Pseudomonadota bacterium]